jgi:hypothetical protein
MIIRRDFSTIAAFRDQEFNIITHRWNISEKRGW